MTLPHLEINNIFRGSKSPLLLLSLTIAAMMSLFVPAVSGGEPEASILFQLDDNLIHVSARLDDTPVSAVLDSGTGGVVMDRATAERLHLPLISSEHSAMGGGNGSPLLSSVELAEVAFGPIHLHQAKGFALDLHTLCESAGIPIDLLLGEPFFAQQVVTIDYPHRRVFFGAATLPPRRNRVPIEIVNGVPVASVTLRATPGGAPVRLRLIVDLGTRHFAAMIGGKFLRSEEGRRLLAGAKEEQIGTGTGGVVTGHVTSLAALEVGEHTYRDLRVGLTDGVKAFESDMADGSLGVPLWQSSVITFDYSHGELSIAEAE